MISLRLDPRLEEYLNSNADNKSDYIRRLVREDKLKNEDIDKFAEIEECSNDVKYFAENYCYIYNPRGPEHLIDLYDYQETILDKLQAGENLLVVKGRQLGITEVLSIYSLWKMLFENSVSVGFKSMKLDVERHFLSDKVWGKFQLIPDWMKKPLVNRHKEKIELQNKSKIFPIRDEGLSRTIDVGLFDEASHINNFEKKWKLIQPAFSMDSQLILSTNGILKDNENYKTLKEIYLSSNFEAEQISYRDHPERDSDWKEEQIDILGHERFVCEYEALIEISMNS